MYRLATIASMVLHIDFTSVVPLGCRFGDNNYDYVPHGS
jgi:hypothetical protein